MMQPDYYPAAEKILSDIETIFEKDPKLCQFEIIPVVRNNNTTPIHHVEHALGLEKWCVPYLYCHAYNNLINLRKNKSSRGDSTKVSRLLMGALLINPDVNLFWNMRKELISKGKLETSFEMHFTSVIISWKPKCLNVFSHRKWILDRLMKGAENDSLLRREVQMCTIAAERYASNYHAWAHRLWALSSMSHNLVNSEWLSTLDWVSSHVSEYSGFHYRFHVINALSKISLTPQVKDKVISLIQEIESSIDVPHGAALFVSEVSLAALFVAELSLVTDLMKTFPAHETLWAYLRLIITNLSHFPTIKSQLQLTEQIFGIVTNSHYHVPDLYARKLIDWLNLLNSKS